MLEALLVSGFIFIGGLFGIYKAGTYNLSVLAGVAFISYTLMLSIYSFNAYLGFIDDKANPRLKELSFLSRNHFLTSTIVFYSMSIVISLFMNFWNSYLHLLIFVLWFLYAVPGFGKHLPVLGTIIHFLLALVQFNFAYSFFSPISMDSFLISCYFGFIFSAGHLHHEIIDYEVDAKNSIKTSTVLWGIKKIKYFSFGMFVLAYIFLTLLFMTQTIDILIYIIFGSIAIFLLILFLFLNKKFEIDFKARLNYRLIYRIIFLISGAVFTCITLFK